MSRSHVASVAVFALFTASALCGLSATSAHAVLVWDRVTLSGARGGLTAVAVDPDDPRIVWVAGGGSVWVTDDEGDTWNLVGHIGGRKKRNRRETSGSSDGRDKDDDDDDDEDEAPRTFREDDGSDSSELDGETDTPDELDDERGKERRGPTTTTGRQSGRAAVIHRLRVFKNVVYVCGDRGLYSLARTARSIGSLREVRFGQQAAIVDVAAAPKGKALWIATPYGLLQGGANFPAVPVFGPLGSQSVTALNPTPDGLYVASTRGLYRQSGTGFVKVRLNLGRRPLTDLLTMPNQGLLVLGALKLFRAKRKPPQLLGSWSIPNVRRMTRDRTGRIWVGGPGGVWFSDLSRDFRPKMQGLSSKHVADLAAPAGGTVMAWAVGRFGAARLVTEAQQVWNERARAMAKTREGMPTSWDVLQASYRSKKIDLESVGVTQSLIRLAWILPDIHFRYDNFTSRQEGFVFASALGRDIFDEVRVVPKDEEVRILLEWDLSALVFWAPEVWTPKAGDKTRLDVQPVNINTTPTMEMQKHIFAAVKERRRVNKQVIPLFNEWVSAKVRQVARPASTVKQAIREQLRLEHVEADLFAFTNGWFRLTTGKDAEASTSTAQ